ncbi:MAG: MFS transporter [bacterium]|nr:MFS transporter [bacterium]
MSLWHSLRARQWDAYKVYLIIVFTWSFGFAAITTVNLVYQAVVAGLSPLQLVLVGTTLEITAFLLEVPTGVVADAYSRRLSVIIGYALIGLGFLVEGLFPVFGLIVLAQVIWGAGITFISGAEGAWLVDEIGEARSGDAFVRASQVGNFGGLVGIGAGSVIAALFGTAAAIVIGALILIGLAAFLGIAMPERGFKPAPKADRPPMFRHMAETFKGGVQAVRGRRILAVLFGITLFTGLYSEGWDRLWTPHLIDNVGVPALGAFEPVVWFGVLRAVTMIAAIGAAEVVRRTVKAEQSARVLWAISLTDGAMIAAQIGFALTGDFVTAAVLYVISQTLRGAISPVFFAWSNRYIESSVRATTLSMINQMNALGQIGGGPGVGWIGERFGVRAALVFSSLLLAPVLPLYAWTRRLARRSDFNPPPSQSSEG